MVDIENYKGGRKRKTRKKRGGTEPEDKEEKDKEERRQERLRKMRERLTETAGNIANNTERSRASPILNSPTFHGSIIPSHISGERASSFVTSPITVPSKKGGRKRSTKKNRRTRKKRGRGYEDDVRAALSKDVITDKKCLDIGTRDGLNCLTLVEKGAKSVLGIDLDESKFKKHQEVNNEKKITLRRQDFLKMEAKNEEEKFDVITCFLWNFGLPQLEDFALKVKSLLRKEGVFILGLYDEIYVNGDEYTDSVPKRLEKYFKSPIRVWGPNPKWKHQYIWEMKV